MTEVILSLPTEPAVGTVVEILDGDHAGDLYEHVEQGVWRQTRLGRRTPVSGYGDCHWSGIWWAVTEDASGGSRVRVVPPDPHPLPWRVSVDGQDVSVLDARGGFVCALGEPDARAQADRIAEAMNRG